MSSHTFLSAAGLLATALGATLLYLASEHQRLLRSPPPARSVLGAGAVAMVSGIAAFVASWGGIVGGLLALAVWMAASVALTYLLARRTL